MPRPSKKTAGAPPPRPFLPGVIEVSPELRRQIDRLIRRALAVTLHDRPSPRVASHTAIRLRAYTILERAVEEGLRLGWNRAHKHTDEPGADVVQEHQARAVMEALGEVVDFGDGEDGT